MDPQPHLRPDLQVRQLDEHVERVGDPAVGRVFQRHQSELDVAAIDLLEDRGDRADRHVLDGLAESRDRGEVAVTILRPQAGHADRPLKGPGAAHQLAEDDPQRLRRQRALARRQGLRDHLVLPGRRPDLQPMIVLHLPDPRRDLRAAIQQLDQLLVQPVDLPPQARQAGRARGLRTTSKQRADPSSRRPVLCVAMTSGS